MSERYLEDLGSGAEVRFGAVASRQGAESLVRSRNSTPEGLSTDEAAARHSIFGGMERERLAHGGRDDAVNDRERNFKTGWGFVAMASTRAARAPASGRPRRRVVRRVARVIEVAAVQSSPSERHDQAPNDHVEQEAGMLGAFVNMVCHAAKQLRVETAHGGISALLKPPKPAMVFAGNATRPRLAHSDTKTPGGLGIEVNRDTVIRLGSWEQPMALQSGPAGHTTHCRTVPLPDASHYERRAQLRRRENLRTR